MDRLDAMALLVRVTEAGSLSAAGRQMNLPLATVSRRISDLEAQLGARLLIRTTRRLTLTEAGTAYVAAARRILEQVAEAERAAAGEFESPRGELVLTAPIQFGRLHVLPQVADFLAAFPDINVRLALSDRNLDLVDAHMDMAVRIGRLPDSSMVATRLGTMRTVLCASPALMERHGTPAAPGALGRLPCIAVDAPLPMAGWSFRSPDHGASIDVPLSPRLTVSTTEAAAEAAIRGVGFARLLQYQVADAVAAGTLRILLPAFEPEPAPVHLLHVAHDLMPLKMRRFLDFATPRLRDVLAKVAASGGT
ncbi:LysR family transcriptional regulator [Xanthobacteraceae bacterium A53D]